MIDIKALTLAGLLLLLAGTTYAEEERFRLSSSVMPISQDVYLKLDPDNPNFNGLTSIKLEVSKDVDHIEFYQSGLEIESAILVSDEHRQILTVKAAQHDIQHAFGRGKIAPGEYLLELVFSGKLNTASDGAYVSVFEGLNYISTQFEDMLARKAFPNFDEPSFKIPYQLTIESPEKHVVLSNTPVQSRTSNDGWQTVRFKRSKPMPSYLVAFAVGEFDSVEITGLSVPGRIYTPKGQAGKAGFIVKNTPKILNYLETYFGRKYPYEKLDFLAVPTFTHGAMENVGLVTYRSEYLLRGDEPPLSDQSRPLMVVAHELAHMWYGNLVTMAWWDDLWLNEAFASWMAAKVMQDLFPEHNYQSRLVAERAFSADADPTTKPVKKQVRVAADVMDGLGLNYTKGAAILDLVETLVGSDQFKTSIQAYMKQYAWKNATADNLWSLLDKGSEVSVSSLMQSYLTQPGYPLVTIDKDGTVTQQRYRLAGSNVTAQNWVVPLSLMYKKGGEVHSAQYWLDAAKSSVAQLKNADWVYPNVNAYGYYRWKISSEQLAALANDLDTLSAREKRSLLHNLEALLQADQIGLDEMMRVLDKLAVDDDKSVARSVVSTLGQFDYLVDESNERLYGKFLDSKLLKWVDQLGLQDKSSDADDTVRLRQENFELLGMYSSNPALRSAAEKMAADFLKSPTLESRQMGYRALMSMAKQSKESWAERFITTHNNTSDASIQVAIKVAMSFSQDADVIKALDFALSDAVNPSDAISVVSTLAGAQPKQDVFYAWMTKNADALIAKMPDYHVARMPVYLSKTCDQHNIKLMKAFYKNRLTDNPGMLRGYEVALSESHQCARLKERYQAPFTAYLKSVVR